MAQRVKCVVKASGNCLCVYMCVRELYACVCVSLWMGTHVTWNSCQRTAWDVGSHFLPCFRHDLFEVHGHICQATWPYCHLSFLYSRTGNPKVLLHLTVWGLGTWTWIRMLAGQKLYPLSYLSRPEKNFSNSLCWWINLVIVSIVIMVFK